MLRLKEISPLFLLLFATSLSAQLPINDSISPPIAVKNDKHFALQATYQNGYVFPTNLFLAGANLENEAINFFQTFSLKFGNQTSGKEMWEQLFNYPFWGGGIYVADFYEPDFIGTPVAVFGFFSAPFVRGKRWIFGYDLEIGLAFNWKPFNPVTNVDNVSIGSKQSVYLDIGTNIAYQINQRILLGVGFSLSHFSNGGLKKPNLGINTLAPEVSLRYNLYKETPAFQKHEIPAFEPQTEWTLAVFGGQKNIIFDSVHVDIITKFEGVNFPVWGISLGVNRQLFYKSKFGIGLTVNYDGAHDTQVAVDENELEAIESPFTDKIQVSIYPSYELTIDRISVILQPSFYIYRKKTTQASPIFHQKIGLKYHFKNNLFIGVNLRAYQYHVSDFLEWTVGYRFLQ